MKLTLYDLKDELNGQWSGGLSLFNVRGVLSEMLGRLTTAAV